MPYDEWLFQKGRKTSPETNQARSCLESHVQALEKTREVEPVIIDADKKRRQTIDE